MAKALQPEPRTGKIRCAVYTRKASEEGLEQEFNSLDAQYEACAAYIASQRHEQWALVRDRYDDGGFSGGNMERPGLQRLLVDVAAGKVDVIVIYKVDRLTRSLADFSKIVDVLDNAQASFVSITQSFNTTTSMGRLMLNVLLSFAQFEREVTGERIRDKIAASKKKGMWMGGVPPLGYEVRERKLIVNQTDADLVRHIFRRYLALGTGRALIDELRADGYRTRVRTAGGKARGGVPFSRGMLFQLLGNRVYLGEVVHRGTAYPGDHAAIVDRDLWDAVQAGIKTNSIERANGHNVDAPSLLVGLVHDGHGRRMTPSHASKGGKRYRYYVTSSAEAGSAPVWRMPASDLDAAVVAKLQAWLRDRSVQQQLLGSAPDGETIQMAMSSAALVAEKLENSVTRGEIARQLISKVQSAEGEVKICVNNAALSEMLNTELPAADPIVLVAPAVRIRRGKDVKLVLASSTGAAVSADPKLVALLAEAMQARAAIRNGKESLYDLADRLKQCRYRLTQLVRLSYLSPAIVRAIIEGRHPADLTPRKLLGLDLPVNWNEQKLVLGLT